MEITKSSFADQLPDVKKAIDNATFLAIDCELTGLNTIFDINAFDTQKQYFEKIYKNSKDFLVIQFGLCVFRYIQETDSFKHKTYNFYIFPRRINRMMPDNRFLCQASSIDFLVTHGFDFNKLYKEGIPYMNNQSIEKYREALVDARAARVKMNSPHKSQSDVTVPAVDLPFVNRILAEIEEFLETDEPERVLPKCNAFVRRIIYQTSTAKINNRARLETRTGPHNDRLLVVIRLKKGEDHSKAEEAKILEEDQVLDQAIGFSKLIQYISESRKLMIGHNMMLDVCHTIDKFLTNIPEDYESFKECVHCLFPSVLDTKYMATSAQFKEHIQSSVLGQMFGTLTQDPFKLPLIEAEEGCPSYTVDEPKEHEAGYDAFITGLCFISMWKFLVNQKPSGRATFENMQILKPFINRLHLMRIQDSPYIQLDGPDPIPSREHVFYISFPKHWKVQDVLQLFNPFGTVFVAWINDTSAYVALHRADKTSIATALGTLSPGSTYKVMTYAQRQSQLNAIAEHSASAEIFHKEPDFAVAKVKKRKANLLIPTANKPLNKPRRNRSVSDSGDQDEGTAAMPDPVPIPRLIKPRKRTISKTFAEDDSWE